MGDNGELSARSPVLGYRVHMPSSQMCLELRDSWQPSVQLSSHMSLIFWPGLRILVLSSSLLEFSSLTRVLCI